MAEIVTVLMEAISIGQAATPPKRDQPRLAARPVTRAAGRAGSARGIQQADADQLTLARPELERLSRERIDELLDPRRTDPMSDLIHHPRKLLFVGRRDG